MEKIIHNIATKVLKLKMVPNLYYKILFQYYYTENRNLHCINLKYIFSNKIDNKLTEENKQIFFSRNYINNTDYIQVHDDIILTFNCAEIFINYLWNSLRCNYNYKYRTYNNGRHMPLIFNKLKDYYKELLTNIKVTDNLTNKTLEELYTLYQIKLSEFEKKNIKL